ncbi:MAG: hypothetical protein GY798_32215 [Hyphomicrobiales bacterium]|nr:hypothetical protein [Hyphomicrobiales bacterium]
MASKVDPQPLQRSARTGRDPRTLDVVPIDNHVAAGGEDIAGETIVGKEKWR